jgi:glucose/arabinose dehydrogenase
MLKTHLIKPTPRLGSAFAALALLTTLGVAQIEPSAPPQDTKDWHFTTVAEGLRHPWGMAWLPDGQLLVTAKHGTLHTLRDGRFVEVPLRGLPDVFSAGQGALMDIAPHPRFNENRWIYLTLSTGTQQENRAILVRGVFDGRAVSGFETLFQVDPSKSAGQHFGSRLLWLPDGTLLMSIGDGGNPPQRIGEMLARDQAQNLSSHLGSIVRLTEDGKAAPNNPFINQANAKPELWTYGNRNIQGLALDPESGRVWANEHSPRGGDELNLVERGGNYGWPLHTYGRDYRTGEAIGQPHVEGIVYPKVAWSPATGPSGLAFYHSDRAPEWRGSIFSGGLASKDIRRIILDDAGNVTRQERFTFEWRIRDVRQSPDGHLYALTDEAEGKLLRIEPGSTPTGR